MSKKTKKILGASLSLAAFSFSYISTASAQTCTQPMTCEEMGYIDTVDRCEGSAMIKCPSDLSKVFCRNRKACTPNACSGYTLSSCPANGNCSICNKVNEDCSNGGTKYKLYSCKTGYKISGNSCIKVLSIGDILYSDMTTSSEVISGKTPIGIVYDVNRKLAISLEQSYALQWASSTNYDIPGLTSYSALSEAEKDYNGKNNTSIIRAHGDSKGYSTLAADYAYNYSTAGTNKGDWYLPALGELQLIYNNKDTLNNSLDKVKGTQIGSTWYWSSSECNLFYAWLFDNGDWKYAYKYYARFVRPSIAF